MQAHRAYQAFHPFEIESQPHEAQLRCTRGVAGLGDLGDLRTPGRIGKLAVAGQVGDYGLRLDVVQQHVGTFQVMGLPGC